MAAYAVELPRAERMAEVFTGIAGAGICGIVEGVIVRAAPRVGAAAPFLTWGTLLGVPIAGSMAALFSKGTLARLFEGVAMGGTGILGYSLPALLAPSATASRATGGAREIAGRPGVKELPAGPGFAPQRAQAQAARVGLEF